jgi:hypothetical protein
MNENTKELFRQALELVLNGQDPDNDIDDMYIPRVFVQRYTELIVRECARVAIQTQTYNDIDNVVSENPAKDFSDALIKHFGVK